MLAKVPTCHGCGRPLAPGSLKYIVQIKVYADFDGFLSIADGEDLEAEMDRILKEIQRRDPREMEEEVHQEIDFLM